MAKLQDMALEAVANLEGTVRDVRVMPAGSLFGVVLFFADPLPPRVVMSARGRLLCSEFAASIWYFLGIERQKAAGGD